MGCSPWGHKEVDMTEQLSTQACSVSVLKMTLVPLISAFIILLGE